MKRKTSIKSILIKVACLNYQSLFFSSLPLSHTIFLFFYSPISLMYVFLQTDECTVNINLLDVNDNPPVFDPDVYSDQVYENETSAQITVS